MTARWDALRLGAAIPRQDQRSLLPSFFIVGPPRTGTSWLHEILKRHTILPGPTKETRFFDIHFHRGLRWYRAHYPRSGNERLVGEVAPTYFASPEARSRIKELIPSAKIICTFRNPVERVISLYRIKRAYGIIPWSFEEAVLRDAELMESSKYATHLRAWQQAFGVDRVLPTFYDDLRDTPQAYVDSLADFIGTSRFTLTLPEFQAIFASESMTHPHSYDRTHRATRLADWLKAQRLGRFVIMIKSSPLRRLFLGGGPAFAQPSQEAMQMLHRLIQREVEELETMVNRDLSAWKLPPAALSPSQHYPRGTASKGGILEQA